MSTLDGSPFEAIFYRDSEHMLVARLREIGTTFVYEGVPRAEYDALMSADSAGSYFNDHIQGQFPCHRQ